MSGHPYRPEPDQPWLFDDLFRDKEPALVRKFREFHEENPRVYYLFKRFTFDAINAGFEHYSSDAICHRIRWHTSVETRDPEGFKINDHYTAFYGRLFMAEHAAYEGFFRTRKSAADEMEAA